MFVFREVLFCLILPLIIYPSVASEIGFYLITDIVFLNGFNLFILFLTYNSVISQKIFTYYVAILALIDNGILNLLILNTLFHTLGANCARLIAYMISISFIFEGLISIYLVYINRFLSWMDVFKKLGANNRIRNAYFYRQILKAFIPYEFFVGFQQLYNVLFPGTGFEDLITILHGLMIGISFLQIIFICVNFDDENVLQRKIAIFFTFVRILMRGFQLSILIYKKGSYRQEKFFTSSIFTVNYMIAGSIVLVILFIDMSFFGSGLKRYLKSKPVQISLS